MNNGRQFPPSPHRKIEEHSSQDASWREAIALTVALWLFVLLLYLPLIARRHAGEGPISLALDCMTIFVSMGFALTLFALFRATLTLPGPARALLLVVGVLTLSVAQAAFDLLFTAIIAHTLENSWQALPRDLARGYGAMINYISVFAVNLALYQFSYARHRSRRGERQLAELMAAEQQAELAALRFKLSPHFLFNTLNALSAMIVTRRNREAELIVERLSAFLRASFPHNSSLPIAVEQEFATIENYAGIEELRFGDRIRIDVSCTSAAAGLLMPPLLIQPILEQLVDAAAAIAEAEGRGMRVQLDARTDGDALSIMISHDAPGLPPLIDLASACIGPRLALLFNEREVLRPTDPGSLASIELRLPREPEPASERSMK